MSVLVIVGFCGIVFGAVFLLTLGLTTPASGDARMRRALRRRLDRMGADELRQSALIIREKYLQSLSPFEQQLEELPYMEKLAVMSEQAGIPSPGYRVVMRSLIIGGGAAVVVGILTRVAPIALVAGLAGACLPVVRLVVRRRRRFEKIEEQLPDAIDVMKRALRAGHPFNSALKLVAEDMDPPIAKEFELVFSDVNYGNDVRRAMLGLLSRVPSVTVMALVTSVLVQRETGGNLAEILDQIAGVVRGRFRFQRKVRTLSAEGRLSAWVLAMVPLALIVLLSIVTPDYLPILLKRPVGHLMIYGALGLFVIGIFWISRVIRIEV